MKESKVLSIAERWKQFIIKGGNPSLELLYPYSTISLKKRKNLRKFKKAYYRYIDMSLVTEYWGLAIFILIYKTNLKMFSLSLPAVEPFNDQPKVELVYPSNEK